MKDAMSADISVVVETSYDGEGFPQTQVNPIGAHVSRPSQTSKSGTSTAAEAYHPYGFLGRPRDADLDSETRDVQNGARVLFYYEGSTLHSIALDDPRVTPELPEVEKGGSLAYAAGGSYLSQDPDGNATLHVPSGKKITIEIEGGPSIEVSSTGVRIKGVTPAKPVLVGDAATANPANAVLYGAPASGSQFSSTIIFTT